MIPEIIAAEPRETSLLPLQQSESFPPEKAPSSLRSEWQELRRGNPANPRSLFDNETFKCPEIPKLHFIDWKTLELTSRLLTLKIVNKNSGRTPLIVNVANPGGEENGPQASFLLEAFKDVQGVIRATDSKVAALSFGLAVPLTKFETIWGVCQQLLELSEGPGRFFARFAILIFGLAWIISLTAALRTLLQIDNPANHIGGDRPSGVFYSPTLFRTSFIDAFIPRRTDPAARFDTFFASLPSTDLAIRRELAFELMKAVYIRTIKLQRAKVTYLSLCTWLVSGSAIWISTLILSHRAN